MADNNSNTSSNNSEPETELSDFSTLNPFEMEQRKNVSNKKYTLLSKDVLSK